MHAPRTGRIYIYISTHVLFFIYIKRIYIYITYIINDRVYKYVNVARVVRDEMARWKRKSVKIEARDDDANGQPLWGGVSSLGGRVMLV